MSTSIESIAEGIKRKANLLLSNIKNELETESKKIDNFGGTGLRDITSNSALTAERKDTIKSIAEGIKRKAYAVDMDDNNGPGM